VSSVGHHRFILFTFSTTIAASDGAQPELDLVLLVEGKVADSIANPLTASKLDEFVKVNMEKVKLKKCQIEKGQN
jgi:hypothetical protein